MTLRGIRTTHLLLSGQMSYPVRLEGHQNERLASVCIITDANTIVEQFVSMHRLSFQFFQHTILYKKKDQRNLRKKRIQYTYAICLGTTEAPFSSLNAPSMSFRKMIAWYIYCLVK